jgi:nucleotide-binding universal stress UspA family protein
MFKHILLPTDGSSLSEAAMRQGIQLAKAIGARVTGLHVILPFHVFAIQTEMVEDTREQYERESKARAEQFLGAIRKAAQEAGVKCDTFSASSPHPYEMIIEAAEKKGCDLVVMASHGRSGIERLVLGSVTQSVLTHSKIPVLVLRGEAGVSAREEDALAKSA